MRDLAAVLCAAALLCAADASAQEKPTVPRSGDGWAPDVGTELRVTSRDGHVSRGRLRAITQDALLLTVDSAETAMPRADVARIERRGDSLKNGFLIGAIVGILPVAFSFGEVEAGGGQVAALAVIGVGTFGLVGMGIDAMHNGWTTVYRSAPAPSTARARKRQLWAASTGTGVRFGYTRRF